MPDSRPGFDPGALDRFVRAAPRAALLLDYDGTLAPFSSDRAHAGPYPGVLEALAKISGHPRARVGIVSGRPRSDLERLLGVQPLPELWGSHGLERRRPNGESADAPVGPELARFRDRVSRWVVDRGWSALLERKPYGLALHRRGVSAPEFETASAALLEQWSSAAAAAGLEPLGFDDGIELRPVGRHKGEVVKTVLAELGPGAAVAYLGDDRTDEDAFNALRGRGLPVLVRKELRPTGAELWIRPPDQLLEFLSAWEAALRDPGRPARDS
jgi:trehalose 6-phosphate phosphatase